jgi:hypothetical protein
MLPDTAYYTTGLSFTKEQRHPETQPGEMFLTNVLLKGIDSLRKYSSLRIGYVAYDINERVVGGCFPVFVSRNEHREMYGH